MAAAALLLAARPPHPPPPPRPPPLPRSPLSALLPLQPPATSSSGPSSRFFTPARPEAMLLRPTLLGLPRLPQHQKAMQRLVGRVRRFATGGGGGGTTKLAPLGQGVKGLGRPVAAANSAVARYREAAGLQVEAFRRRNYLLLVGAGGVVVCTLDCFRTRFVYCS